MHGCASGGTCTLPVAGGFGRLAGPLPRAACAGKPESSAGLSGLARAGQAAAAAGADGPAAAGERAVSDTIPFRVCGLSRTERGVVEGDPFLGLDGQPRLPAAGPLPQAASELVWHVLPASYFEAARLVLAVVKPGEVDAAAPARTFQDSAAPGLLCPA